MLADMAIKIEAARCLIYKAATNASKGTSNALEGSIAKTFANEMVIEVTNIALQLFGGYGYSRELPIERMYRDARAWAIAGGTTQIQRNTIAAAILGRRFDQRKA
jgi:butyryl-CoA dehydrogenase